MVKKKNEIPEAEEQSFFTRTETRNIKYVFDDKEKLHIGEMIALENQDLRQLEDEKKSVMSGFSSKLTILKEQIGVNADKLASGYEYRNIEVEITLHKPIEGQKTLKNLETGEESVEVMEQSDHNLFTQFQEGEKAERESEEMKELEEEEQEASYEIFIF